MAEPKFNIQTEGFTALTPSSGNVQWRAADTLKTTLSIGTTGSTNIYITNLKAGMSGIMRITIVTSDVTINPLPPSGTLRYSAGKFNNLVNGVYIFCWEYDGTNLFYNIARYVGI